MPIADPAWTRFAATATAWLLTYSVHSTLLLGGTWLAARLLAGRRLAVQEALWKLALVGGLVTATLQLGLGWRPVAGAWSLGLDPGDPYGAPARAVLTATADPAVPPLVAARREATASESAAAPRATAAGGPAAPPAARGSAPAHPGLLAALGVLAVAGGLLGLIPLASAHLRLARRLRGRTEVATGPLRRFLRRLERAAGFARPVRLTATSRLATPIARGLTRTEICLPERALLELAPAEQEGVVAHELAHLARRDPAWLLIARTLEALLVVQPLNRLARRRLVEIAEYRADDWAAGHTGRPLDLARCLTEVAGWSVAGAAPLPVPGIAAGTALGRRVRRLLERRGPDTLERTPRWLQPAGLAALVLVALTAPGVVGGEATSTQPAAFEAAPALIVADLPVRPVVRLATGGPVSAPVAAVDPDPDPDVDVDVDDDEIGEWIEDEIERGFDRFDEELERALEPLEEDLEAHFDAFDDEFEQRMEAVAEELEHGMESLEEEMETLAEEMAQLHAGGAFDVGDLGVDVETLVEEMVAAAERFQTVYDHRFDQQLQQRIAELTAAAMPSQETLHRIRVEAERLSAEARGLAEQGALSEAERDRLRLEARAVAELARPDEATLAELREKARQLAEAARPSPEELDALRAALDEELPRLREQVRAAVERQRAALERHREALDRQREAMERSREADAQRLESERRRAELDRQRAEAERERAERERGENEPTPPPP